MSVYKIYGTSVSATVSNSLATLDIQVDGLIVALLTDINPNGMDALNDEVLMELSFLSSNTFTINDSRGSLIVASLGQNFLTSGGGVGGGNASIGGLSIPVNAGERIHLHTSSSSGVTAGCTGYLYVNDGVDLKPARRRR